MVVHRLLTVLLGMSALGGPVWAQVESTGFEAEDGWVAGYSICGPEFAATCSYPITNACVPDDHVANQNCCSLDPNPATGWYMSDESQHCNEPHIDEVHPFSGLQHLRFQRDPATAHSITATSPHPGPQLLERSVISFQVARGEERRTSSNLEVLAIAEDDAPGQLAASVLLVGDPPTLYVWDDCESHSTVAPLMPGGVYGDLTIDLDPGDNAVRYCYAGNTVFQTKLAPGQANTVQQVTFRATNSSGTWDIDDFSITRGGSAPSTCREFPSECQTPCGPRPCVSLKAVAVNGESIAPTTDVHVRPGDVIETEIFFSGWGGNIPSVQGYEYEFWLGEGATSGVNGTVLPLGWDAPITSVYCTSNANCPSEYPICMQRYPGCVGPNHDPKRGAFITTSRADYLLFGFHGLEGVRVAALNYLYYALTEKFIGPSDNGVPRYVGSLLLVASEDSCGTFTFGFLVANDYSPIIFDTSSPPVILDLNGRPLTIHVCAEDVDSCPGVGYCGGACCDSWIGDCQDFVDEADCTCPNCVWTGGAECADVECMAEFVVIPTVSEWGLVVLTLLLLTGGKVMFGVRSTSFPSSARTFMASAGCDSL